jgi:hypothetical protein
MPRLVRPAFTALQLTPPDVDLKTPPPAPAKRVWSVA